MLVCWKVSKDLDYHFLKITILLPTPMRKHGNSIWTSNTRLLMTIYKFFFTYGEGKLYKYIRWSQNMMTMTFFNFCFLFHWEAWEFYIYFKSNLQHVSLNIWKKEPYKFSTKDSSCYMHLHYSIIMDLYNTSDPVL